MNVLQFNFISFHQSKKESVQNMDKPKEKNFLKRIFSENNSPTSHRLIEERSRSVESVQNMGEQKEKNFFKRIFSENKTQPSRRLIEKRSRSAVRYRKIRGSPSPSPPSRKCDKCCCAKEEEEDK